MISLLHQKIRDVKRVDPKIAEPRPKTRAQIKKDQKKGRERFLRVRNAEVQYRRQLRALGKQVGVIVKGIAPDGIVGNKMSELTGALNKYAEVIQPWAKAVAGRMLADVERRDATAWNAHGNDMGLLLRGEINSAPVGDPMRELLSLQTDLITSIPREAAQRVRHLATESLVTGRRASAIADEILRSGDVSVNRAETIARTEVARAASTLTMARALHIGAEYYIWRTSRDGNVRHLHEKLDGKIFKWTEPPVAGEDGERANPGCIYNCRCWPEPIIPDTL